MVEVLSSVSTYLPYIAPPLIGAFIGYLTNKVAIRMLFRPLKPWRILGIRVPMTPGVIPGKRHLLAVNIGEMVGGHLLTSNEIGKALEKGSFQNHLGGLIKDRVGAILHRDLPPLPVLIPQKYSSYFDIAAKTVSYQCKQQIFKFILSEEFEKAVANTVRKSTADLLDREVETVINQQRRNDLYGALDRLIEKMLASEGLEHWLEDFLYAKAKSVLRKEESVADILPPSLIDLIITGVESKTPDLLLRLSVLAKDPGVQEKVVEAIKKGIDSFASSLGPMGGMVQGFLKKETIEKAVRDYLQNNEEEIARWLQNEDVQKRVSDLLVERVQHYLQVPLHQFFPKKRGVRIRKICRTTAEQLAAILREKGVAEAVGSLLRENLEEYLQQGDRDMQSVLIASVGEEGLQALKSGVAREATRLLRSNAAKKVVDDTVEQMLATLLQKPVGKLSNLLPLGVREGMYESIRKVAQAMLATEVPGLVASLNIQGIVAEKVDSLDLLRLERLLLSIMEEQFKYINLFGALLGFFIGAINVLIIAL